MTAAEPPSSAGRRDRVEPGEFAGLPAEIALARLPAGRHGLPRSFVAQNQRMRLLAAMVRLLPECGYPALTIGQLTGEAGVSRAAFYGQFSGKEDCFLAAYEVASRWLCERVGTAVAGIDDWEERIRVGATEALRLLAANEPIAHLLAVEAYRAGEAARDCQQTMLGRFAAALRDAPPRGREIPGEIADLLLGGIVSLVARYVSSGRPDELTEATAPLVEYLLIPYLGADR
jgi:AcrR family transcriptional regulator